MYESAAVIRTTHAYVFMYVYVNAQLDDGTRRIRFAALLIENPAGETLQFRISSFFFPDEPAAQQTPLNLVCLSASQTGFPAFTPLQPLSTEAFHIFVNILCKFTTQNCPLAQLVHDV